MVKRFEKGSLEFQMFGEYYKLCQKHWINDNTQEYYDSLVEDCEAFAKRFSGSPMAKHMALALLDFAQSIGGYPTENS